jgi:hypothetical protein
VLLYDLQGELMNSSRPPLMALVHNAGKLKFGAEKKRKNEKKKSVFELLDTLELAANGPREHI